MMNKMRERLYRIIERGRPTDNWSKYYDIVMLVAIIASIIPLMFIEDYSVFKLIERITVILFILDYLLRWSCADIKFGKNGWSFLLYPLSPMAMIDMLSILPGLNILSGGFKILRLTRMFKILRLFRLIRYTDKIEILLRVLKKEKGILISVLGISVFYVFITALIMFNAEPYINPETGDATFTSFFDALYWATVTLTTVGYGDLCPVTDIGRCVSMISSLFGVAIIALPSGVITASYLDELRTMNKKPNDSNHELR